MSIDNGDERSRRKLSVVIEDFHAHRSGSLYGFIAIVIPELHLRLSDCTVHRSHDKSWIGLPGKAQIDRDGNVRRDPTTGKALYTPVVEITDRATRDRFSERAITALLERFPLVFQTEEAAE